MAPKGRKARSQTYDAFEVMVVKTKFMVAKLDKRPLI